MAPSKRGLSLLYVGTLPPHPGGSAISGGEIIAGLAARGHAVRAVAPMTPEAAAAGDAFAAAHPGIVVSRFSVPYFETDLTRPSPDGYRAAQDMRIAELLAAQIATERPDVVFVGRESFAWVAPDLAQGAGIPCVLRLAGGTTTALLNGAFSDAARRALVAQFRKVDAVVSPGRALAQRARRLGLEGVRVIPTGIDLDRFAPAPQHDALRQALHIGTADVVVAYPSNIKPVKRPLDVVRSALRALQQDPRLVYVIVGDGIERPAMEAAAHQGGVQRRFRFVGWRPYDEMPAYLRLADVVLRPSSDEGLARIYLETQASGRVLLASDIPPAREVIVDGETGFLFRTGDVDDLAAKTLRVAADPTLRADVSRKARAAVRAHSLPEMLEAYEALLYELCRPDRHGGEAARPGPGDSGN